MDFSLNFFLNEHQKLSFFTLLLLFASDIIFLCQKNGSYQF